MRLAKVCLVILCAVSARADSLGDLKAAVATLRGTAPIRATVEMHQTEVDRGKKPPETVTGAAAVDANVDAEGLHVAYAPALLARVAKEQAERQANNEAHTPTTRAMAELSPLTIAERLDFGRRLLGILAKAEVTSEKRVVYDGKPARLLAMKVKTPTPKTSVGHVEILEDTLNVWMGDDNLPLAAQRIERYSGGIMFLKMQIAQSTRWNFVRRDDRLVAVRGEEKSSQNGFGQNNEETNVATVMLR